MDDPETFTRGVSVLIGDVSFAVGLEQGGCVTARFRDFPRLAHARGAQLRGWEWNADRTGIRWPELDEDISVWSLVYPEQTVTSLADVMPGSIVSRDPEIHSGDLVFTGTRVPVSTLIDHLKDGSTLDEFLVGYPSVARWQAEAVLRERQEPPR